MNESKIRIGDVLDGKYRLIKELGKGGMGSVYEAIHEQIGSRTAIKILGTDYAQNEEAVARFQLEARAAAAVGHDAIIGIQDIGVAHDGSHYLVMEYLKGSALGDVLARENLLGIEFCAYVVCQVLSGLVMTHEAGIIHRDLKPDNIFLVDTGAPLPSIKILDFGISRILDSNVSGGGMIKLTQTGFLVGTPAYMSPEHARGKTDVDHRADIYALGVILYECLTGRLPHEGENYNAILTQIITEDPTPPRILRPDIPPQLEALILRTLDRDRDSRYQSAFEMFCDLMVFVGDAAKSRISLPEGYYDGMGVVDITGNHPHPSSNLPKIKADTISTKAIRRGQKTWLALGGALMILAGVTVGIVMLASGWNDPSDLDVQPAQIVTETAESPQKQSEQQDASVTKTEQTETVTFTFQGLPQGSKVFLDDTLVEDLPMRLKKGGPMVRIRVEAQGFQDYSRVISTNADRTIQVEMAPEEQMDREPSKREKRSERSRSRERSKRRDNSEKAPAPDYEPSFFD